MGEPAGIGPDIALQLASRRLDACLVAIVDPDILEQRATILGLDIELREFEEARRQDYIPGSLFFSPLQCPKSVSPGKASPDNQAYVLETIRHAARGCMDGRFDAMVTGPVNKAAINQAGFSFSGHTEFLADICKTELPVMVLDNGDFRVALLTTHLPLSRVSSFVTRERVVEVVRVVEQGLRNYYSISEPAIMICGLNPHAGEQGELGREEIDEIIPAIEQLKKQGTRVSGPVPADTAFTRNALENVDIVVAMYHDQGLPALKSHGFGDAVNITFGLPIVRTSVDHGTAFDLAGRGLADPGSLERAVKEAIRIANLRSTVM